MHEKLNCDRTFNRVARDPAQNHLVVKSPRTVGEVSKNCLPTNLLSPVLQLLRLRLSIQDLDGL